MLTINGCPVAVTVCDGYAVGDSFAPKPGREWSEALVNELVDGDDFWSPEVLAEVIATYADDDVDVVIVTINADGVLQRVVVDVNHNDEDDYIKQVTWEHVR
jgi:hypothetical protein